MIARVLDEVKKAFEPMHAGKSIRGVVTY